MTGYVAQLTRDGYRRFLEGGVWRWFSEGVPSDILEQYGVEPDEIVVCHGNLLLNEGIQEMWDLIMGTGATLYNNANADIGVGDTATAAAATQTDLQPGQTSSSSR